MCSSAWDFLLSAQQGVNVECTKPQVWVENQRWLTAYDWGYSVQHSDSAENQLVSAKTQDKQFLVDLFIYLDMYIHFAAKVCDRVCHIVAFPGTISDWDWFPPSADAPNWLLTIGAHANKVRHNHNPCLQSYITRSEEKNLLTFKYDRSYDLCSWQTRLAYQILLWSLICSGWRITAAQCGSFVASFGIVNWKGWRQQGFSLGEMWG